MLSLVHHHDDVLDHCVSGMLTNPAAIGQHCGQNYKIDRYTSDQVQCESPHDYQYLSHSVGDFYRRNYKSAGGKRVARITSRLYSGDTQLCLTLKQDSKNSEDVIAAGVRLQSSNEWYLLRGLCVAHSYRRQGWATLLLQHVLRHEVPARGIYLFTEPSLATLYEENGFSRLNPLNSSDDCMPQYLAQKYKSLNKHRTRHLYVRPPTINVLLLQHNKEVYRKSNTAQLLHGINGLSVDVENWAGRVDNERVEQRMDMKRSNKMLLWAGGSNGIDTMSNLDASNTTFVLLDGTWQEAKAMLRKIPRLALLPKLTLQDNIPSRYRLRGDYTGWRTRFAGNSECLLCTAETVAEIMRGLGKTVGEHDILSRLDSFQDELNPPRIKQEPS